MAVGLTIGIDAESKGVRRGLAGAERQLDSFGRNLTKSFAKVGAGLGVALGLRGLGQAAVEVFRDIDAAQKVLVSSTGATGSALRGLEKDVQAVARVVPQGATEIAGMVGQMNTLFGVTGDAAQELAKLGLDFGRLTGIEGTKAIRDVAGAMKLFGEEADQTSEVLGDILKASQLYGAESSKLIRGLAQYGPTLSQLGLSLEEVTLVLGQFSRAGVQVERLGEPLRQFVRNATKSGQDVRTTFLGLIDTFSDGQHTATEYNNALKLLGSEGINAVVAGARNIDLSQVLGDNADLVSELGEEALTLGERFAIVGNNIQTGVTPVFETVLPILEDMAEKAAAFARVWGEEGIEGAIRKAQIALTDFYDSVGEGPDDPWWERMLKAVLEAGEATVPFNEQRRTQEPIEVGPDLDLSGNLDRLLTSFTDTFLTTESGHDRRNREAAEEARKQTQQLRAVANFQTREYDKTGNLIRRAYDGWMSGVADMRSSADSLTEVGNAAAMAASAQETAAAAQQAATDATISLIEQLRGEATPIEVARAALDAPGLQRPADVSAAQTAYTDALTTGAHEFEAFGTQFLDSLEARIGDVETGRDEALATLDDDKRLSEDDKKARRQVIEQAADEQIKAIENEATGMVAAWRNEQHRSRIANTSGLTAVKNAVEGIEITLPDGTTITGQGRGGSVPLTAGQQRAAAQDAERTRRAGGGAQFATENPLGLNIAQTEGLNEAFEQIRETYGSVLPPTSGGRFGPINPALVDALLGEETTSRLRMPRPESPESRRPFDPASATTGRAAQTNRAIRVLAQDQERATRARSAGFDALSGTGGGGFGGGLRAGLGGGSRAFAVSGSQLAARSGGLAGVAGGTLFSGQLGYLSAALGTAGLPGAQPRGFSGLSSALQQSALQAASSGTASPAASAVRRAAAGLGGVIGVGGAGIGGGTVGAGVGGRSGVEAVIEQALGLRPGSLPSSVASAIMGGSGVGGGLGALGDLGTTLTRGVGGPLSGLFPGRTLVEGAGEVGRSLAAFAGDVLPGAVGGIGGLAAGLAAGGAGTYTALFGAGALGAGISLATPTAATVSAVGAGAALGTAASVAAPALGVGLLAGLAVDQLVRGFLFGSGQNPRQGVGVDVGTLTNPYGILGASGIPGFGTGRDPNTPFYGTTINNNFPAGTDPGAVTRAQERQRQLGYSSRGAGFGPGRL